MVLERDLGRFLERAMLDFMHVADPFGVVAARTALNEAGVPTIVDRGREWWMLYGGFTEVSAPTSDPAPKAQLNDGDNHDR